MSCTVEFFHYRIQGFGTVSPRSLTQFRPSTRLRILFADIDPADPTPSDSVPATYQYRRLYTEIRELESILADRSRLHEFHSWLAAGNIKDGFTHFFFEWVFNDFYGVDWDGTDTTSSDSEEL